jgi:hypothetical protein
MWALYCIGSHITAMVAVVIYASSDALIFNSPIVWVTAIGVYDFHTGYFSSLMVIGLLGGSVNESVDRRNAF